MDNGINSMDEDMAAVYQREQDRKQADYILTTEEIVTAALRLATTIIEAANGRATVTLGEVAIENADKLERKINQFRVTHAKRLRVDKEKAKKCV